MGNRRISKIWVATAFLFMISWAAIAVLGNFLIFIRIKNIELENKVKSQQQKIDSLSLNNNIRQESDRGRVGRDKYEEEVLEYLEWQFVLKEQVSQAKERLVEEIKRTKEIKRNNRIKNILYYNLGLLCVLAKDFNSAIEAFEKALVFNPKDSRSQYNLGLLYSTYRQDSGKAVKYYRKYLILAPAGAEADAVKERIEVLEKKGKSK